MVAFEKAPASRAAAVQPRCKAPLTTTQNTPPRPRPRCVGHDLIDERANGFDAGAGRYRNSRERHALKQLSGLELVIDARRAHPHGP